MFFKRSRKPAYRVLTIIKNDPMEPAKKAVFEEIGVAWKGAKGIDVHIKPGHLAVGKIYLRPY